MANYLKGIGDAATRTNEILPSFDARINGFLIGHTSGILKNEYNEFAATAIDRGVLVKAGMMQAYGFFGCTDADTRINFVMPSTTSYLHLYAEIDLSVVPNRFEIKATSMSNSSAWSPRQDNLKTVTNGKYQFPLWLVTLTASTIMLSDRRVYIDKPLNAKNAEAATNATNVITGGSVNTSSVTTSSVSSFFRGYTIPDSSIPTATASTIANLTGSAKSNIQQSGTLSAGWYKVELGGGGGGGGGGAYQSGNAGGTGGSLSASFFVPFTVNYRIMAGGYGGGGNAGSSTAGATGTSAYGAGGGGGGGSVLSIPQLGILFIANGGGGGGAGGASGTGTGGGGGGGGGGGFGAGGVGAGRFFTASGGAAAGTGGGGGGNAGKGYAVSYTGVESSGDGSGMGGGKAGTKGNDNYGGYGGAGGGFGGVGGNGTKVGTTISPTAGGAGGNNLTASLGGGGTGGTAGGAGAAGGNGGNGYARLYKLG